MPARIGAPSRLLGLVDGAARLRIAEHQDGAADAAPARVVDVVAEIAAALGTRGGLGQRRLTPAIDQLLGALIGLAIDHELHCLEHATSTPSPDVLPSLACVKAGNRERVNMAATMTGWRGEAGRGTGSLMANRPGPQAGGFIIAVAILAGTIIGGLMGQPSIGLLAGLGLGAVAALAVWWRDRARR